MKQIKLFGDVGSFGSPLEVKLDKTDEKKRFDEVEEIWSKGIKGERFDVKTFMFLSGE